MMILRKLIIVKYFMKKAYQLSNDKYSSILKLTDSAKFNHGLCEQVL